MGKGRKNEGKEFRASGLSRGNRWRLSCALSPPDAAVDANSDPAPTNFKMFKAIP